LWFATNNKADLSIQELKTEADYEFRFHVHDDQVLSRLKQLRSEEENNDVLTDVHFATQTGNVYIAAVRHNFRIEFVLLMFKYGIITAVRRESL
jgi:hypothetical protein